MFVCKQRPIESKTDIDNSHKLIDNCHQLDSKCNLKVINTKMLSNTTTDDNKCLSIGSKPHLMSTQLMATELNSTDVPINGLSTESQTRDNSDCNKSESIKECIQQTISEKTKKRITTIINEIQEFNDIEKLLLYIQLPNGSAQEVDPLKQKGPGNPFGKKADIEVAQTYTWIQSHLEEDSTVSLPKQEVYEEYKGFCDSNKFEPLCVADFGKAMKHVFPKVKPRRLGQRGNSKYCYSGLRKKINIEAPELPILDTSGYESIKSNKNWETDRNGVSNDESVFENEVVISWANKLFERTFDSIPDLAQFLITSNSVDISVSDRNVLKSNEEKLNFKLNSKSGNGCRRRDIHNQLQRKIQEKEYIKEQKRRSDLKTIESMKAVPNGAKPIRKSRKNSASKADDFESTASFSSQNAISIKKEPEIEVSSHFQTNNQFIQTNRPQNKVAIPRTVTPSRMTQPPPISTSIILVPTATVRLASPKAAITNESTATTTVSTITTSPQKPNTSKYKRIQPKPVNICRSDSESAVSLNSSNDIFETFSSVAKRRHSVSVPIGKESKLKQMESFGDKQSQPKRQIEEKESVLVTKKRHIDNMNAIQTLVSNSTNSSGFEDANSSNSLSPISQELQTITTGCMDSVCASDIRIHELESEALMDYFNSNSFQVSNACKEHWDVNSNGNQTAQLSQLRKLLENHLPNSINKTGAQRVGESVPLEGYSELREALLRKNLNNSVQSYGHLKNTIDSNEQNVCSKDIECPQIRQMDGSVGSPVLESLHSLSGLSSLSTATKGSQFGDYFEGNHLNDSKTNGLYHNVNIQVPSVPPSPNARRRAFNFQPISPRNTPTIPENSTIDSIGFNGFNYNNHIISSPPQYRLNQQTIGVGPSQPSSEANSPFVSPRSTPVTPITPLPLIRSRHNSGQSNYSALRQTPLQNIDSGVSSISSSPFISPQSTPLPISRVRAGTGGMQRSISRVRHSSGPGGPTTMSGITGSVLCNRSNSLSPMIGDNFNNGLPNSLALMQSNGSANNPKSRTPNSPLSPLTVLRNPDTNCLTSDPINGSSELVYNSECEPIIHQNDWPNNRVNDGSIANRQRHSSNPYNTSASVTPNNLENYSNEIMSYMKNSVNERLENGIQSNHKFVLNRCQSVPIANIGFMTKNGSHLSPTNSVDLGNHLIDESTSISKSYPATPVCAQPFQFPPSPPSSTKQQMAFSGDDIISGNICSGQDLMVSGVQLRDNSVWNTSMASTQHNDNELIAMNVSSIGSNSGNVRRNLNDLLAEPPDDLLGTTLDDLRDCDTEFSKFAQELEDQCNYDDLS